MKRYIIDVFMFSTLCVLAVLVFLFSSQSSLEGAERLENIESMEKGQFDFSFQTLKKKNFSLKDFKGKVVLVNLWAVWCPPCIEELPSLKRLAKVFPNQLVVIAVTEDERQRVDEFMESIGGESSNFIVGFNDQTVKIFSPQGLPESYLFDTQGRLLEKIIGPRVWDNKEWQNKIKSL